MGERILVGGFNQTFAYQMFFNKKNVFFGGGAVSTGVEVMRYAVAFSKSAARAASA